MLQGSSCRLRGDSFRGLKPIQACPTRFSLDFESPVPPYLMLGNSFQNRTMDDIEDMTSNQCGTCKLARDIPEIPQYAPYTKRDLVPGEKYQWCSCGKSKMDPFCDQSGCKGTNFVSLEFVAKTQTIHLLCGCKYTTHPPFCDGKHATMDFEPQSPPCNCETRRDLI